MRYLVITFIAALVVLGGFARIQYNDLVHAERTVARQNLALNTLRDALGDKKDLSAMLARGISVAHQ